MTTTTLTPTEVNHSIHLLEALSTEVKHPTDVSTLNTLITELKTAAALKTAHDHSTLVIVD